MFRITDPGLCLEADGAVRSSRYGDCYFQPGATVQQRQQVFIDGCDLPWRWQQAPRFTIAETGFGLGINFLQTWRQWRRWRHQGKAGQRLHYVAAEAHPLSSDILKDLLPRWPELSPFSAKLMESYPALTPGYHRVELGDGITLTLLLGDALSMFGQLEAVVDAWYLDGFAPSKNPAMWQPALFQQIGRLSRPGAMLATYTAAQQVQEGLAEVGFRVQRRPDAGNQGPCLSGTFEGQPKSACPGWFAPPPVTATGRITVVGAGIAGQSLASAMRRRRLDFELLSCGTGASSNPSVSVMPRLEAGDGLAGQFFWHAYRYALQHFGRRAEFDPCGALQVARSQREADRQARIWRHWQMPPQQLQWLAADALAPVSGLSQLSGLSGLWFPEAGIVRGFASGTHEQTRVSAIHKSADGWSLDTSRGERRCNSLILAGGAGGLIMDPGITFQDWHGQALQLAASPSSQALSCGIYGGRYVHPAQGQGHWVGASFERSQSSNTATKLIQAVHEQYPELALNTAPLRRWSGWRQATADRLPVAGPVLDMAHARDHLNWVKGGPPGPNAPWLPGLFLLGGLGARGFTTAPVLAEWLASMICGDPWPLPRNLALAVCSSRFLVRDLRRGNL